MDNYKYDIYFNKNYHDDVYNNGNYFDAIYLGNKLWWKKEIFSTSLIEMESIIQNGTNFYCLATLQNKEWTDDYYNRYYICKIESGVIIPFVDVTPRNMKIVDEYGYSLIYTGEVTLRYATNDKFLIFYYYHEVASYKGSFSFSCIVEKDKNEKYQIVKTDEKIPDFPCTFFLTSEDGKSKSFFADGDYYYDQISQKTTIPPVQYYSVVRKYDRETKEIIQTVNLPVGDNYIRNTNYFAPMLINDTNKYCSGYSINAGALYNMNNFNEIFSLTQYSNFYYQSITPTSFYPNNNWTRRIDCLNKTFLENNKSLYAYGPYKDLEANTQKYAIYHFDGTELKIKKIIEPEKITGYLENLNMIDNFLLLGKNVRGQTSNDTKTMHKITIINDSGVQNINIAPEFYIGDFCGFIKNDEYISIYVYFRNVYNDFSGRGWLNINKNTLKIESFTNIEIDMTEVDK